MTAKPERHPPSGEEHLKDFVVPSVCRGLFKAMPIEGTRNDQLLPWCKVKRRERELDREIKA